MTAQLEEVFIVSAVRSPITSFRSSFASLSSVDLGSRVAKEAVTRANVSSAEVEETIVGSVLTAGQGQNVARQISIASGIPKTTQCVTVNKVCSSSMKAIIMGTQAIQVGYRDVVLAAGVESMSNAPFYLPRGELAYGGTHVVDGVQRDGLTDAIVNKPMGLCAEKTVKDYGMTREQLDAYAIESYRRAERSWNEGLFNSEVLSISVPQKRGQVLLVEQDEEYKRLIPSKVPTLSPAFLNDGSGTITAANASSINDGAAAVVLVSGNRLRKEGSTLTPLAQVVAYAEAGLDPVDFTIAPAHAVNKLLSTAGIHKEAISLWEINEAFAVTAIAFIRDLQLDPSKVNVRGGAVALGHPIGASGARIVVTLLHALQPSELGVAAICNGGGEASAVLMRRL